MKKKSILLVDDRMLDKVLDMIKEIIGPEKFDNVEILMDRKDEWPDDITLKMFVILSHVLLKMMANSIQNYS